METLEQLTLALLIVIPCGAVARIGYCALKMGTDDEERGKMKKRIKNILVFLVIAVCLASLISIFTIYFPLEKF